MNPTDLYFQTTSRADFEADLLALDLVKSITVPAAAGPITVLAPTDAGVSIDYIAHMVQTPPVMDASSFPPTVTTPATYYPGERANVRLTGALAASRAAALAAATFTHGTVPLAAPASPKRRWA